MSSVVGERGTCKYCSATLREAARCPPSVFRVALSLSRPTAIASARARIASASPPALLIESIFAASELRITRCLWPCGATGCIRAQRTYAPVAVAQGKGFAVLVGGNGLRSLFGGRLVILSATALRINRYCCAKA